MKKIIIVASLVAMAVPGLTLAQAPATKHRHRTSHARPAPPAEDVAEGMEYGAVVGGPALRSSAALIVDQLSQQPLYEKNPDAVQPIASITKLMTALVVLESGEALDEVITISDDDVDTLRNTHSRLRVGTAASRLDLLRLALMASENRAAAALARSHPGGTAAFVALMNEQAQTLGMPHTHFNDATGLNGGNVACANDLAILVQAAFRFPLIREFTTTAEASLPVANGRRHIPFHNTNALVRSSDWDIGLSKTGFINESGQCLVMQARIAGRPTVIVLLDSWGRRSRIGDANRVRRWMESHPTAPHVG